MVQALIYNSSMSKHGRVAAAAVVVVVGGVVVVFAIVVAVQHAQVFKQRHWQQVPRVFQFVFHAGKHWQGC